MSQHTSPETQQFGEAFQATLLPVAHMAVAAAQFDGGGEGGEASAADGAGGLREPMLEGS